MDNLQECIYQLLPQVFDKESIELANILYSGVCESNGWVEEDHASEYVKFQRAYYILCKIIIKLDIEYKIDIPEWEYLHPTKTTQLIHPDILQIFECPSPPRIARESGVVSPISTVIEYDPVKILNKLRECLVFILPFVLSVGEVVAYTHFLQHGVYDSCGWDVLSDGVC